VSTVYVIGAGASYGESLKLLDSLHTKFPLGQLRQPPLTNGFFRRSLVDAAGYARCQSDLQGFIGYVGRARRLTDAFGEGRWADLDLEDVFSALEVEREFHSPESDEGARLLLVRNELVRYVRRIVGICTQHAYGEYCRKLVSNLDFDDSILTFNWDLLPDQEFISDHQIYKHYANLFRSVPLSYADNMVNPVIQGRGLLLKLHGSLNWFRCGNKKCQANRALVVFVNTQACLAWKLGNENADCPQCGSDMNPVIIPPLLRKPITEDPIIRSAWGLARNQLMDASQVVVIRFSAAPTDFYASWLLRSTVGTRDDVHVEIINPCNADDHACYDGFKRRMDSIFLGGYSSSLHAFSQIESVRRDQGVVKELP